MTLERLERPSIERWEGHVANRLAKRWADFVDCPLRLRSEAPFLRKALSRFENPRALDAAMGIGCEVVWLTSIGVDVVGNEVEPELQALAAARAADAGVQLTTSASDWRHLADGLGGSTFDAVLLLGNSLSLLRESRDRATTARSLWSVCRPGGIAIVDERNFQYILSNREEILRGEFRYGRRVVYCGERICGRPVAISDDCVRFGYFEGPDLIGTLDMHPFVPGELAWLFLEAGFRAVTLYSDLELGYKPAADFFTYVFEK